MIHFSLETKMYQRKSGQKKTDLSDETSERILKVAKSMIRVDYGGSDPLEVIRKKMKEKGVDAGPQSQAAIKEIIEEQIESCRKRQFPRIDEVINRLEGKTIKESMI